ncbi:MAG: NUDIX domain-containing protein [Anaerolineae bacterium]
MASPLELNYCPRCGHALEGRNAFGRVRRYCPACDRIVFREHKVAAAVIVEHDGEVLLVRRRLNPRRGLWSLPAGFVDFDETPAQAAVRECREETGLEVEIVGLLDVIAGAGHGDADIVIVYRARWVGGEQLEDHLEAADDVDCVAFFAPDDLPPLAFRATREAIDKWRVARHAG